MRGWPTLLGGLVVWTVHFFAVYAIASIFRTSPTSRILTAIVTLACLAAAAFLTARNCRHRMASQDRHERWTQTVAALAGICAMIAITWQGLPAILL